MLFIVFVDGVDVVNGVGVMDGGESGNVGHVGAGFSRLFTNNFRGFCGLFLRSLWFKLLRNLWFGIKMCESFPGIVRSYLCVNINALCQIAKPTSKTRS